MEIILSIFPPVYVLHHLEVRSFGVDLWDEPRAELVHELAEHDSVPQGVVVRAGEGLPHHLLDPALNRQLLGVVPLAQDLERSISKYQAVKVRFIYSSVGESKYFRERNIALLFATKLFQV